MVHGKRAQSNRAAARLNEMGLAVIPHLTEALARRDGIIAHLDPFLGLFDRPKKLRFKTPKEPKQQRIEELLSFLGVKVLPQLAEAMDHPDYRVRHSIARVMARHGDHAVPYLMQELRGPKTCFLAGDALASIGSAAVVPLVDYLRVSPYRSRTWNAADAALCAVLKTTTRSQVKNAFISVAVSWAVFIIFGGLFFAIGMWAEIGFSSSLIFGFITGYFGWTLVVNGSLLEQVDEGWVGFLLLIIGIIIAPYNYYKRVSTFAATKVRREMFADQYQLPG
jgi:hypothetical protein